MVQFNVDENSKKAHGTYLADADANIMNRIKYIINSGSVQFLRKPKSVGGHTNGRN